jgi:hypothetical protein
MLELIRVIFILSKYRICSFTTARKSIARNLMLSSSWMSNSVSYSSLVSVPPVQREAWQNVGTILDSKAQVASFCLELSKKLKMRYIRPPLPVDLALVKRAGYDLDTQSVAAKFGALAADDSSGYKEVAALFDKTK